MLAVVVFASILLHELAHISAAILLGGQVKGAKLSLVGLTAWVSGLENLTLWRRYIIYLAGPVTNALIAVGAWLAAWFLYCGVMQYVFMYNIVLCLFNMLPMFPLDGGRLAQLFLGNRIGILRANRVLLRVGPAAGLVLIAFGLLQLILYPWNITLLCAGIYIRRKNKELPTALYWECLQSLQAKANKVLPTKKIILPQDITVKRALEYLGWDYFAEIQIGKKSYISEKELLAQLFDN